MPSAAVNHANWQLKTAAEIRRYRVVNKLSIKKACQLAGVCPRWYHLHRDLIERPAPSFARAS